MSAHASSWAASKQSARQELTQIPLPAKTAYASIDQEAQWKNPFLSVESDMVQVRIFLADENSSQLDRGGMTRIASARKQVLNVRLKDLPRALAALPDSAWPYGRVVAIGKQLEPPQTRARLERNLATTTDALNDMGIVVDDWNSPAPIH